MSSFKSILRNELDFRDITVKELSSKTGIPKPTLDHYLGARSSMPPADIAVKIAEALGVTVEYLVNGKDSRSERLLEPEARKLLTLYEILDVKDKQIVMTMIESMASRYANDGGTGKSSSHAG